MEYQIHLGHWSTKQKPPFDFTDRSLNKQQYTSDISSRPPAYRIVEKVKIMCSPRQIDDVKTIFFGLAPLERYIVYGRQSALGQRWELPTLCERVE